MQFPQERSEKGQLSLLKTQLGLRISLSKEAAFVGKSLQKGEEIEEKKRKLDPKENAPCL